MTAPLTVSRPLPVDTTLITTEPLKLLLGAAPIALANRRIICLYGQSGCGKTVALDVLANTLGVRVVTVILDRGSTDKQVIEHLYQAVRGATGPVPNSVRRAEMMAHLRRLLAAGDTVLMVDEAQNASLRALELVRQLHEDPTSRCGLVVAGVNLAEKLEREEMLNNRIGLRVAFPPLTGDQLVSILGQLHPVLAQMPVPLLRATDDEYCHGQLRRWVEVLEWLLAVTDTGKKKPTRAHVEQALYFLTAERVRLRP